MILSLLLLLPLLGALACLALPRGEHGLARAIGFVTTLVTFLLSLALLLKFEPGVATFQMVEKRSWIEAIGASYHVGVDGISLFLVLLTTFLTPIVMLSAFKSIEHKVREFVISMLILEVGVIGTFIALDLFLFYVLFEVMLVPMYLIIGIWGGERRIYASIKFVIYTMVGSLAMLVAIFYLASRHQEIAGKWTFELAELQRVLLPANVQVWCFLAFGLAFAIKVPLFPLHTWLPDAHVEAPTAGSVILAGVLLKVGTYGFLRFAMPLFPAAAYQLAPWMIALAVIGIVYGALVAYAQNDVKKLVAYSSVSHLGVVVLGTFAATKTSVAGGLYTMIAHGLSTGGLFLWIGAIYERRHTRRIDEFGGLWAQVPVLSAIFMIFTLASVGLPGLCGFVGEFLTLAGSFGAYAEGVPNAAAWHPHWMVGIATTAVILGAVYMLTMYQKVIFGPLTKPENRALKDASARELGVFVPVIIMIVLLGVFPQPLLARMNPAVGRLLEQVRNKAHETDQLGTGPARMLTVAELEGKAIVKAEGMR